MQLFMDILNNKANFLGKFDKFCGNYTHEKTIACSNINKTERTAKTRNKDMISENSQPVVIGVQLLSQLRYV